MKSTRGHFGQGKFPEGTKIEISSEEQKPKNEEQLMADVQAA